MKFPEIVLEKMKVYRVKEASSVWTRCRFRLVPLGCGEMSSASAFNRECNLNGFSPNLRRKHLADSSSVLSESTLHLLDKSSLISGLWTPAGYTGVVVKN